MQVSPKAPTVGAGAKTCLSTFSPTVGALGDTARERKTTFYDTLFYD